MTTTALTTTSPATPALTRDDRCDRCSAAAKVRSLLPTGGELLFCAHHARKHLPRLRDIGATLSFGP
ncbi:hypothetical protein [Pseudonocardia sp.]|jgi:hypothetical protein|uniref:DUF7455 domain-containing protein n=1 Tax=Pseudonocardia sp. TaxID=60912 RepID=UPI0031FDF090